MLLKTHHCFFRRTFVAVFCFFLWSCGGGGDSSSLSAGSGSSSSSASSSSSGQAGGAPPALSEPAAQTVYTNHPVNFTFENSGGTQLQSCTVQPALPQGLALQVNEDNSSCELTGTAAPELEDASQSYTVTATNAAGHSSASLNVNLFRETAYITTWDTTKPGSNIKQITIQTSQSYAYDFNIDWGDGSSDSHVDGDITHTYDIAGIYNIKITGIFPQPFFKNQSDAPKLLAVDRWGRRPWSSMRYAFYGAKNMILAGEDTPDLSQVDSMMGMFYFATGFNHDISHWDVSNVSNMRDMFAHAQSFNQNLAAWNVSSVRYMNGMFMGAKAFNQNIGTWDLTSVVSLVGMFADTELQQQTYDAILMGWAAQDLPQGMHFSAGSSVYSQTAEAARKTLINDRGWTIDDGGKLLASGIENAQATFFLAWPGQFTFKNNGGGSLNSCTVDPALPEGLLLSVSEDLKSCTISGTANAEIASSYTVSASNESGSNQAQFQLQVVTQTPYVTTWKTDNDGVSSDRQITINTSPDYEYLFDIDWGDGQSDSGVSADITHTYMEPGTYTVRITGIYPQPYFIGRNQDDARKLVSVEQWGNGHWRSMRQAFLGASSLVINAQDTPDLSLVRDMSSMFNSAGGFPQNIGHWDVSNVTAMSYMFAYNQSFNQDLSAWDVSKVVSMNGMFRGAIQFNGNIDAWDVANLTEMSGMFQGALVFNRDISAWNVANVEDMSNLFRSALAFDQDLSSWNFSKVFSLNGMLAYAALSPQNYDALLLSLAATTRSDLTFSLDGGDSFYTSAGQSARDTLANQLNWTIVDAGLLPATELEPLSPQIFYQSNPVRLSLVNRGGGFVDSCTVEPAALPQGLAIEISPDKSSCTLSGVVDAEAAVASTNYTVSASNLSGRSQAVVNIGVVPETAFVTTWDTSLLGASGSNQLSLTTSPDFTYHYAVDWGDGTMDRSVAGDISHTYARAGVYTVRITGNFPQLYFPNTANSDANKLLSVDQWGQRQWLSMHGAFYGARNMQVQAQDTPDLSLVSDMSSMFAGTIAFNQDIGDWDVSSVTDMSKMFYSSGFNHNIGDWDVSSVTDMSYMFYGSGFNQNIGGWDVSGVRTMAGMFADTRAFNQNIGGWDVSGVRTMAGMFADTTAFNQDISGWDISNAQNVSIMFADAEAFDQDLSDWVLTEASGRLGMLYGVVLSPVNYDALLIAWAEGNPPAEITFRRRGNYYSAAAQAARDTLINTYGWTFEDGGLLSATDLENPGALTVYTNNPVRFHFDNGGGGFIDTCAVEPALPQGLAIQVSAGRRSCSITGVVAANASSNASGYRVVAGNLSGNSEAAISINLVAESPFITTWNTEVGIGGEKNQIKLPTSPDFSYHYQVDWGDGSRSEGVTGDITHTYATPGIYTVAIRGNFPQLTFQDSRQDAVKLQSVEQWGQRQWLSMRYAFAFTNKLVFNATDVPDLNMVRDMSFMFYIASQFNQVLDDWDVSRVENMSYTFSDSYGFNQNLSAWDVSAVTTMRAMFRNAWIFNQNIASWDTSALTDMGQMFDGARAFNQELSEWDVSQVTSMEYTFAGAVSFDQNLGDWDFSSVSSLYNMFANTRLSPANYDALLLTFADTESLQSSYSFDAGSSYYTSAAQAARDSLINHANWRIADAGLLAAPELGAASVQAYSNNPVNFVIPNQGGPVSQCAIEPALPEGLFIALSADKSSCAIGGTAPEGTSVAVVYRVSASNLEGSSEANTTLNIIPETAFITTWDTTRFGGISEYNQITLNTAADFTYNYHVNWGDGSSSTGVTGDITHSYDTAGVYTIEITGEFPQPYFPLQSDADKLVSVDQWGQRQWLSMEAAFYGAGRMIIAAEDAPDLSQVSSMVGMFYAAGAMNQDISHWDVSTVTSMASMFHAAASFNQDLGAWDVSNVTSMDYMFFGAAAFDQDIGTWDVSSVESMDSMFLNAASFNQNIGAWDVANVRYMPRMFQGARAFNQDLNGWDVSQVLSLSSTFSQAESFNGNISDWDVANVLSLENTFEGALVFNQDISAWDVSEVKDMGSTFENAAAFDQDLSAWDITNVEYMEQMFSGSGLSTVNYDALLNGWSEQDIYWEGVTFDLGATRYSAAAEEARNILVNDYGWNISDGGLSNQ